jgi:hypothetical protein
VVIINLLNKKKSVKNIYPSLFEVYQLGDRVKRTYTNKDGKVEKYSGIILSINTNSLEIYWDTINGRYEPDEIDNIFDNCKLHDVFYGNEKYSQLKKEKYILYDIFKILYIDI